MSFILINQAPCQILWLLAYLLIYTETGIDFCFVHFVLTQNEPKSQERPKVFRKSPVVLPNVGGTKDLRTGFTFELLLWHTTGRSATAWRQYWSFKPDNKVTKTALRLNEFYDNYISKRKIKSDKPVFHWVHQSKITKL